MVGGTSSDSAESAVAAVAVVAGAGKPLSSGQKLRQIKTGEVSAIIEMFSSCLDDGTVYYCIMLLSMALLQFNTLISEIQIQLSGIKNIWSPTRWNCCICG